MAVETRIGKKGTTYRVRRGWQGRTHTRTFDDAERAAEFDAKVDAVGFELADLWLSTSAVGDETAPVTVGHFVCLANKTARKRRSDTRDRYRRMWDNNHCGLGLRPVQLVQTEELQRWADGLVSNQNFAKSYVQQHLDLLRAGMKLAVKEGVIEEDPAASLEMPICKPARPGRNLTNNELNALRSELTEPIAVDKFDLLLNTGLRIGESVMLQPDRYTHELRLLSVHEIFTKSGIPSRGKSKNGIRSLHVNDKTDALIMRLCEGKGPQDLLFQGVKGDRMNPTYFRKLLHGAGAATKIPGLDDVRPHDLRHTHASKLIAAGVDVVTVAKRLGHSVQMTIQTYGHLDPKNALAAAKFEF